VTIPWNQPFQNQSYAAVCSDEVDGASGSDSAIAIYSGSKLPGSIVVIPEIVSGTVHCIAAPANAQAVYSFVASHSTSSPIQAVLRRARYRVRSSCLKPASELGGKYWRLGRLHAVVF